MAQETFDRVKELFELNPSPNQEPWPSLEDMIGVYFETYFLDAHQDKKAREQWVHNYIVYWTRAFEDYYSEETE